MKVLRTGRLSVVLLKEQCSILFSLQISVGPQGNGCQRQSDFNLDAFLAQYLTKDIFEWENSIIRANKQENAFKGGHVCL